jgi:hypothetical protein
MADSFRWRCPFCDHHATIKGDNYTQNTSYFTDGNKNGPQAVTWTAISCPNPECGEYSLNVIIRDYKSLPAGTQFGTNRHKWQLLPAAEMKVLPDYLPAAVLADYKEACLIATLSPKASATLARRCLQGMIRDFWEVKVKSNRLIDEIKAIEDKVDKDAWDAIEAVRHVGNIGAHMEADINVIVDVEPEEAKLLISLIETLVDEWYVARHDRKSRLGKLVDLAKEKLLAKKAEPSA